MGKPVKARVALRVRDLKTGAVREIPDVPMTAENRKAILSAAHERAASRSVPEAPRTITRKQAEEDCAALRSALVDGYSYVARRGVDLDGELAKIRSKLGDPVDRRAFGLALMKLLALFGDGHTRLADDPAEFLPPGFAPFLAAEAEGRIVAFKPDRSAFLAPDAPFLVTIDGVDTGRWIEAARVDLRERRTALRATAGGAQPAVHGVPARRARRAGARRRRDRRRVERPAADDRQAPPRGPSSGLSDRGRARRRASWREASAT